jgi:hypothetical protein
MDMRHERQIRKRRIAPFVVPAIYRSKMKPLASAVKTRVRRACIALQKPILTRTDGTLSYTSRMAVRSISPAAVSFPTPCPYVDKPERRGERLTVNCGE